MRLGRRTERARGGRGDLRRAGLPLRALRKEADTIDADGDDVAASVGLTLSVVEWTPARDNAVSDHPDDQTARDRIVYLYHHLTPDSLLGGTFDSDFDGTPDEDHPDWSGTLDWLGVQHYARLGVTGQADLILGLMPCFLPFDGGACLPPLDPTYCVPEMGYEYNPPGLHDILADFSARWPDLPMIVSEGGIATEVGSRRAENVVRTLEQIERARALRTAMGTATTCGCLPPGLSNPRSRVFPEASKLC